MKTILKYLTAILLSAVLAVSCGDDENGPDDTTGAPVIAFQEDSKVYNVKVGRTLTIEPRVENDADAAYSWTTSGGEILCDTKIFSYSWPEPGQVYITFKVVTPYGEDDQEIRVDIAKLVPPAITLAVPNGGYELLYGDTLELKPVVSNADDATFLWTVDGKEAGTEKDFSFSSTDLGIYQFVFYTKNEDGEDSVEFSVTVKNPEDMTFSWVFDATTFYVSKGRYIRLMPYDIENAFDAKYIWSVGGEDVQEGESPVYKFTGTEEGVFDIRVTMKNSYGTVWQDLTVEVCPAEGTHKRTAGGSSDPYQTQVFEFLPAPGQFINSETDGQGNFIYYTTMEEATAYAKKQLEAKNFISLGAWGGYVVVGFDHSIENKGNYDFQIKGNPFDNSSEPGIVWVMQDENGDGLPNDTWYELKGSEYGAKGTIQDYSVTYYFNDPRAGIAWTDNRGESGTVDYNSFHPQDYYYPLWAGKPSYTLRGTRLESRTENTSEGSENWVNRSFDWGYADNFSLSTDMLNDQYGPNHFRISDAVTYDGQPANLKYIDFIKVQTGVQAMAGWLGEVSTEVFYFKDNNI